MEQNTIEERRKADPSELFLYWFSGIGFLVPILVVTIGIAVDKILGCG